MTETTGIIQEAAGESVQEMQQEVNGVVQFLQEHLSDFVQFGIRLLVALFLFLAGRLLIKWLRKSIRRSFERSNADQGVAQFTDSVLKFGLNVLLILAVAANLGLNLSSVTVLFASAGVGISLALQGSLSNFAGGVLILLLKPFVVGDYIIEGTNKNEGTVKEIRVFHTKLQTLDNKTVIIPNGMLCNNSLINVTEKEERQLDLKIGISYESDLKKAKALLQEMLEKNPSVIQEKGTKIFVDDLGDSAVILGVRAWVGTEVYWETKWQLLEELKLTFDAEGIVIPYHQVTVHMEQ